MTVYEQGDSIGLCLKCSEVALNTSGDAALLPAIEESIMTSLDSSRLDQQSIPQSKLELNTIVLKLRDARNHMDMTLELMWMHM